MVASCHPTYILWVVVIYNNASLLKKCTFCMSDLNAKIIVQYLPQNCIGELIQNRIQWKNSKSTELHC